MTSHLTCAQVSALLSYYIDDKLNDQLKQFVRAHLEICPTCRAKYDALKDMMISLKEIKQKLSDFSEDKAAIAQEQKKSSELYTNISAYIDNELNDDENLRVKKAIISNPIAREDFEKINNIRKLLNESFEKTKNENKTDFSKFILRQIDIQEEINKSDPFARIVAMFILIMLLCTIGAVLIISI
jgi:anti-sigma factor RsiW